MAPFLLILLKYSIYIYIYISHTFFFTLFSIMVCHRILNIVPYAFEVNYREVMAPHSSTLAWKIPWMEEPGRLQSMGSLRVRHD